jgi:hypothetical protein
MGKDIQVRLVHVQRRLKVTTQRLDKDLVDFVLHDEVWQPPALCPLNRVPEMASTQELLFRLDRELTGYPLTFSPTSVDVHSKETPKQRPLPVAKTTPC